MKYLLIALILFSCSKQQVEVNSAVDPSVSEITFNVPAGHFVNPVTGIKVKGAQTYYSFSGIKAAGELAEVRVITDSLKTITYHQTFGNGSMFSLSSIVYGYIELTDYLDITISSYSNGVVNGTFSGRVTSGSFQPTIISGTIKNAVVKFL